MSNLTKMAEAGKCGCTVSFHRDDDAMLCFRLTQEECHEIAAMAGTADRSERPLHATDAAPAGLRDRSDLMAALEAIAGGHIPDASTLAINGQWQEFGTRLQAIARAALAAAAPRGGRP
jgi:hypothetical protein